MAPVPKVFGLNCLYTTTEEVVIGCGFNL